MTETQEKQYTLAELREMGAVLTEIWGEEYAEKGIEQRRKANNIPAHGTTALLNTAGVRPDMHSAMIRPSNFAEALPVFPSEYENELYEVLTGQTADSGTNPDDTCSDPAVTGYLKTAQVKAVFGTIWKGTKQIVLANSMSRKNRADVDRRLINFEATPPNPFTPSIANNPNINTAIGKELIEFGHSLRLGVSHVNIQGDKANTGSSAYSGFVKEWDGVDKWIKTGYVDEVSSIAAPALDSLVTNYGNGAVDAAWYTHFANVVRTQMMNSDNMGFGGTTWVALVHPYAMYPMIDTVSCAFLSTRCETSDASGRTLDVTRAQALRDDMLRNMYLPVDAMRVPLLTDWGVPATYNAATNQWTSDLYLVPLASGTGESLTYMEYLPLDLTLVTLPGSEGRGPLMTLNNNMFIARMADGENLCISFKFFAKMRMIMRTPFLAARIDDFTFTNATPFRSPIIGEQYYRDGGQYLRS